ncbi:4-hydroxybenzoate octaprenyltransferase [Legionella busanensis]|uniref:4-hydroxybenzoate octaprenyltransferase n=1 Tax=Legionella busanensis TaxID=190655 RepID=A0A378JK96_9GAMM|nr:decaprenyl-phosphate phosphoribosyltransferase [Legionella busanensis]STX51161.1 4-hydroxybenzoate octaprenyltransferase [Legionella busanensis]
MPPLKKIAYLLRLPQWSKAAFVFLGVIYSGLPSYLLHALLAAFAFCLLSSAVYIYNDLHDREHDKVHPKKCRRPLASGEISLTLAQVLLFSLLIISLVLALNISNLLFLILLCYLIINLAYNYILKKIPILDVLCIASGFMLRVLAGTLGIGLPISWWLTCTATLISLFIAFSKRSLEKKLGLSTETRVVLKKYSQPMLDSLIMLTGVGSFLFYLLYTIVVREEAFYFLITLPFAAIGLWRFAWLSNRPVTYNDDPMAVFFHDFLSRLNLLIFLFLTFVALANG